MLNVPELEQQYKKRVYKKYAAWIIVFLIISIISAGVIYFKYNTKNHLHIQTPTKIAAKSITPSKKHKIKTVIKKLIHTQTIKATPISTNIHTNLQNIQVLQPSMQFIHNIHSNTTKNQYKKIRLVKRQTAHKIVSVSRNIKHKTTTVKHKLPIKVIASPIVKQGCVTIKSVPISKNMQNIIKRFRRTNDPVLGLFLARRYYHLKKYNLAYNYALLTNQLDSSNKQSWIIFAKSLVKLGQKKMAIQTLKSYIKMSHSNDAAALLEDIQSGRFK